MGKPRRPHHEAVRQHTTKQGQSSHPSHCSTQKQSHNVLCLWGVSAVGWWCLFHSWCMFSCSTVKVPRRFSIQESTSKMLIKRWLKLRTHGVTRNEMRACQPADKSTDLVKDWNLLMKMFVELSAESTIVYIQQYLIEQSFKLVKPTALSLSNVSHGWLCTVYTSR